MTLTQDTPAARTAPGLAWSQALQAKLMAALDAAWAILERNDDPGEIRRVRDRVKAIGEIAAMARKVALIVPLPRKASVATPLETALASAAGPVAAQVEPSRRALDRLRGGGRARL